MNWKSEAVSCRGVSHRRQHTPCQDYGAAAPLTRGTIVGAVADGAGSARRSEIGAMMAVETALSILKRRVGLVPPSAFFSQAAEMFADVMREILIDLSLQMQLHDCELRELACTLIVFVASPHGMAALQIGDGFLVVRDADREGYDLLFRPQHGEYKNETTFVVSPRAQSTARVVVRDTTPAFICASTDGLEHLAIENKTQTAHAPFFKPFDDYLKETDDTPEVRRELLAFLDSEDVNQRTDDDKTLLLCAPVNGAAKRKG